MFRSKILFVVGAGASAEAKLPTGAGLKKQIAERLDIEYDVWAERKSSGDGVVVEAIRQHYRESKYQRGGLSPYLKAAGQIRDAMPQSESIDDFIDDHRGNQYIELCGKLAITRCILDAEMKSYLYTNPRENKKVNYPNLEGTWYNGFWNLLKDKVSKSEIDNIFNNVSFIIFNYDRCVEQYLMNIICNYYDIEEINAIKLFEKLKIYHPYGTVGKLTWQIVEPHVPFGEELNLGQEILQLSNQIMTFSQSRQDKADLEEMRKLVHDTEVIVFLGFAFYEQNMELLKPAIPSNVKRIFATAYGISDADCNMIKNQFREIFGPQLNSTLAN